MADNITIKIFNNFFANTMDCILQGLYGYGDTSIYWILGLSSFVHIISLRKNVALLGMIQSLQTKNELLFGRINTTKNQNLHEKVNTITDKIESISI